MKSSNVYKMHAPRPHSNCIAMPIVGVAKQAHRDAQSSPLNAQHRKELMLCDEAVRHERNRMAADIHDTLAQGLNAIILQLEAAKYDFFANPKGARQKVRRTINIASNTLAAARRMMWTSCHEPIGGEDFG